MSCCRVSVCIRLDTCSLRREPRGSRVTDARGTDDCIHHCQHHRGWGLCEARDVDMTAVSMRYVVKRIMEKSAPWHAWVHVCKLYKIVHNHTHRHRHTHTHRYTQANTHKSSNMYVCTRTYLSVGVNNLQSKGHVAVLYDDTAIFALIRELMSSLNRLMSYIRPVHIIPVDSHPIHERASFDADGQLCSISPIQARGKNCSCTSFDPIQTTFRKVK